MTTPAAVPGGGWGGTGRAGRGGGGERAENDVAARTGFTQGVGYNRATPRRRTPQRLVDRVRACARAAQREQKRGLNTGGTPAHAWAKQFGMQGGGGERCATGGLCREGAVQVRAGGATGAPHSALVWGVGRGGGQPGSQPPCQYPHTYTKPPRSAARKARALHRCAPLGDARLLLRLPAAPRAHTCTRRGTAGRKQTSGQVGRVGPRLMHGDEWMLGDGRGHT
jgi:hypothetical protein